MNLLAHTFALLATLCTAMVSLTAIVFCMAMGANASPADIRALRFWMIGLSLLGVTGIADYDFLLRFEAAEPTCNYYSFHMHVSWADQAPSNSDYYRKTSGSWFALWMRDFIAADHPRDSECFSQLYRQLCEEALNDDQQLDSIAAIQLAIIPALQSGASFCTSHKEGGTNIYWKSGRFMRSDYGDYPDERHFEDKTEFLRMLRQFCQFDVTRNSGKDQLSEIDTWRLILRRMDPK